MTCVDLAREMIDLSRRRMKCDNILFLIDEAGQYVAPRGELILNLDGLARNLKELGPGQGVDRGDGSANADRESSKRRLTTRPSSTN